MQLRLGELYHKLAREFASIDDVYPDLRYIICFVLGISPTEFIANSHMVPHERYVKDIYQILRNRAAGIPLAYILKKQNFYGLDFHVTQDVLIPRPETELLVESAIAFIGQRPHSILEIGAGSGCVSITLKKNCPHITIQAWDISEPALKVAKQNADFHEVDVEFVNCDALDGHAWVSCQEKFDLIIANPPYISTSEARQMSNEVLGFEPHLALFAEDDGLAFYKMMVEHAIDVMQPNAALICEIGYQQGRKVREIFEKSGWTVSVKKDYAGHDRNIIARPG